MTGWLQPPPAPPRRASSAAGRLPLSPTRAASASGARRVGSRGWLGRLPAVSPTLLAHEKQAALEGRTALLVPARSAYHLMQQLLAPLEAAAADDGSRGGNTHVKLPEYGAAMLTDGPGPGAGAGAGASTRPPAARPSLPRPNSAALLPPPRAATAGVAPHPGPCASAPAIVDPAIADTPSAASWVTSWEERRGLPRGVPPGVPPGVPRGLPRRPSSGKIGSSAPSLAPRSGAPRGSSAPVQRSSAPYFGAARAVVDELPHRLADTYGLPREVLLGAGPAETPSGAAINATERTLPQDSAFTVPSRGDRNRRPAAAWPRSPKEWRDFQEKKMDDWMRCWHAPGWWPPGPEGREKARGWHASDTA